MALISMNQRSIAVIRAVSRAGGVAEREDVRRSVGMIRRKSFDEIVGEAVSLGMVTDDAEKLTLTASGLVAFLTGEYDTSWIDAESRPSATDALLSAFKEHVFGICKTMESMSPGIDISPIRRGLLKVISVSVSKNNA